MLVAAACGSSSSGSTTKKVTDVSAAGGMSQLVSQAKKEGTVLFYCTASQDKMAAWVKGFTAKYGIQVQIYRAPTNPLYQRFSQEEEVGRDKADVLQVSDLTTVKDAINKKYLAKYAPQTAGQFPSGAIVPNYAYPMYTSLSAVAWNTKLVPKDLQAKLDGSDPLNALLDPRLKGKVAAVDVTAGGPELANDATIALHLASKYGWPYVRKLAAQKPTIVDSTTSVLDAVESGDDWATVDGYSSVFGPGAVAGAPVAFRNMPDASSSEFYFGTVQQAPHPYAARLFEEWATSLPAQSSLANITQADVLINGWKDTRKVSKEPWYHSPNTVWTGWVNDPRIAGSNLQSFYNKWQGYMGKSG
jgi:iron(III) transport system substrate-binding protein